MLPGGANVVSKPTTERPEPLPSVRLSELPVGTRAVVERIEGTGDLFRRLLEMGFCNRARVTVVRRAPLGDPVEYSIRGYSVSLRKDEARCVMVVAPARYE